MREHAFYKACPKRRIRFTENIEPKVIYRIRRHAAVDLCYTQAPLFSLFRTSWLATHSDNFSPSPLSAKATAPRTRLHHRWLPARALSESDIQTDLDRRRPGTSRHVTQRREADEVEILSGVFEGRTTGTPIALLIRNTDQRSKDYGNIARDSAPATPTTPIGTNTAPAITAAAAAALPPAKPPHVYQPAGAIAKKWLSEQFDTEIIAYVTQIGEKAIAFEGLEHIGCNPFFRRQRQPDRRAGKLHGQHPQITRFCGCQTHRRGAMCPWAWVTPYSTASMPTLPTP